MVVPSCGVEASVAEVGNVVLERVNLEIESSSTGEEAMGYAPLWCLLSGAMWESLFLVGRVQQPG